MIKFGAMRFVAVIFVVFCINTHVLADFKLQGPVTDKEIEFATNKFKFNLDYTKTYAYYNTTFKSQEQYYTLDIGGCTLEFRAWFCGLSQTEYRHQMVKDASGKNWLELHDDFPTGSVESSSISFHAIDHFPDPPGRKVDESYTCTPQFNSNSVPGKYLIKVSLTGADVAPDLIVNFVGEDLSTTTKSTTTSKTTTRASTSTTTPPVTTPAPTIDPCDEVLSEPRYFCNDDGYVEE